jgi:hypothetical protein
MDYTETISTKLKEALNSDIYSHKYIKIPFWRQFYAQLATASSYLIGYIILHMTFTHEIEKLDFVTYWNSRPHQHWKMTMLAVFSLLLFLVDSPASKGGFKASPKTLMLTQLFGDFMRVGLYLYFYLLLDEEIFETTTDPDQQWGGILVFLTYILFLSRKLLFWISILLIQKMDTEPWNEVSLQEKEENQDK